MVAETIPAPPRHRLAIRRRTALPRRGRGRDIIKPAYGRILLDRQARRYLGMSGDEFKSRYRAGTIEDPHRSEVIRMAMLLPFTD